MEKKSIEIYKKLDEAYPKKIEFIKRGDPFRFLCTVILSASSTDREAMRAEERLHSALPSAEAIADAESSQVEELIKSAGLYKNKARSIKAIAEVTLREGRIPETVEELIKIPGIGVKTANCYLVDILDKPGVIVDTHFARVVHRLGLTSTDDRDKVYREIRKEFDPSMWSRLSMTANLHGRKYCKARSPLCSTCFLSSICPSKAFFCKGI